MSKPRSVYAEWLSAITTVDEPRIKSVLDFLSSFDTLKYTNANLHYDYAKWWCQLAQFLYDNREKQLYSDKLEMLFEVDELDKKTNIYWFEVLRACDLLTRVTISTLIKDLSLATGLEGYAQLALMLPAARCASSLVSIRQTVGVCHYLIHVANVNCLYLSATCPQTMKIILKRYHTFRVIGAWLQGLHQLVNAKDLIKAHQWFKTCESMTAGLELTDAAEPILKSAAFFKFYALVHRFVADNKPGIAMAFIREAKKTAGSNFKSCVASLQSLVPDSSAIAVPDSSSPLLRVQVEVLDSVLLVGDSPLSRSPLFVLSQPVSPSAKR